MNERDTEIICGLMLDEGYAPVYTPQEADLVIYNKCSVRKHAEDRVWGSLKQIKSKGRDCRGHSGLAMTKPIIGLVGCMGKAYESEIFKKLPNVDFVCGPANIYEIPELVEKVKDGETHLVATDKDQRPMKQLSDMKRDQQLRLWVNISQGCNNFCSYCIVPHVRGREISRSSKDIISEIEGLIANGTKEVTLLGQNVNSYDDNGFSFVQLLERVNSIEGLTRLRFMTSHPKDAHVELFKAIKSLDKVCEHIHLPIQSGSDRVLNLMNRKYTSEHYLNLVDQLRKEVPNCAISTDIIVGFPTETDQDFKQTYDLMEKIGFNSSFIFKYSTRPYTKAAEMKDDVPMQVKEERNYQLLELQEEMSLEQNQGLVGSVQESLGIRKAKRPPQGGSETDFYMKGRIRTNQQVVYKADDGFVGEVSKVKILSVEANTLIGEMV